MVDDPIVIIAYDCKLMRPACVIVAAGMGASNRVVHAFDTQDWLLAPTPDMRCYPLPMSKLPELVKKTREARKTRKSS